MSKSITDVLYIGNNAALVDTLLSLNSTISNYTITHLSCDRKIESVLSNGTFSYLICEQPVSTVRQSEIANQYPSLQCHFVVRSAVDETLPITQSIESNLLSPSVKTALNRISLPIYYKNKQGVIISCNRMFAKMFNQLPDDLTGKNLDTVLINTTQSKIEFSDFIYLNSPNINLLECEIETGQGCKREYVIREEVIDGKSLSIGMLLDISDINAANRAVEKERVMLRATTDTSDDLIFFKDIESRFIGCNKQFEEFVGCSEAEIIGKKDDQLFELEQALMCQAQDDSVISQDLAYEGNEYLTYQNGDKHYIHMQKVPLKDKQGNIQGLIGIGRDITEKSLIQKQLKVANVVFENSKDGILITNGEDEIISLNHACEDILGYSKSELLTEKISNFDSGGNYRRLFQEIERALAKSGQWQGHANLYKKKGILGHFWLEVYEVKHPATQVTNRVYSFTDLTDNKYNQEKVQYLSRHDALTGLHNRISLFNHLESAITRAAHKQMAMGLLYIEINGIKSINEHYGYNQGDLVIKDVAKRMKEVTFDRDMVARISGSQFALVIEELENEQVIAYIAQKIAKQFVNKIVVNDMTVNLSASIGISMCPDDGVDLDTILSNAESAMMRSKEDESNHYHFYTNELTLNSVHQIELENELKQGLEKSEFDVYYQPQYELNSQQIVAVECLLYWNHPTRGLLPPSEFLILAEQSGVLMDISLNMFQQAAQQAVKWDKAGIHFGRIAMPLCQFELSQVSLIGRLQQIIQKTGCKAHWFDFEIEERLFNSDIYTVQENILNCSRLGMSLTVAAFYSERSILYAIGKINIQKFKVAKPFLPSGNGAILSEAVVKSARVLASSLGMDIVEENIPTNSESHYLMNHNESSHFQTGPMKAGEATFYLRCNKRK